MAFSWLFLYPYRGYGLKPVKRRGCVVHCVTSKNSQKGDILQMEKTGPHDLVFQRILVNEIPSDRYSYSEQSFCDTLC